MKVVEFSTRSNPESWAVDDDSIIEFHTSYDASKAEILFQDMQQEIDSLRIRYRACQQEKAIKAAQFELAINNIVAIKSFVHPDGFVVNGKGYSFHPPDSLVREAWEALSKAIREIDIEKLAKGQK